MLSIYDVFAQDPVATMIVFFLLLVLVAYVVARKNSVSVFAGLGLIIVSLFVGPFAYLKRAVLELAEYRSATKSQSVPPKQTLLFRFFAGLQALLVVFAVALLATGLVSAWYQFVPSKYLRDSIGAAEESVKKLNAELPQLTAEVERMETLWSARGDSIVAAYDARRPEIAELPMDAGNKIADRLASFGDTAQQAFNEIKNYHTQNASPSDPYQIESVVSEIGDYIQRQGLSSEATELLSTYNDLWHIKMLAKFDVRALTDEQVRFAAFPGFPNRQKRLEYVKTALPEQEKSLIEMRSALRYDFGALGTQLLVTLVEFLLLIWLVGLIIEWAWLGLEMAGHLRKLRENSEEGR